MEQFISNNQDIFCSVLYSVCFYCANCFNDAMEKLAFFVVYQ